jgi:hypothetical protein
MQTRIVFVITLMILLPFISNAVVIAPVTAFAADKIDTINHATVIKTDSVDDVPLALDGAGMLDSKLPALISGLIGSMLVLVFGGVAAFSFAQRRNYLLFSPGGSISDQSTLAVLREYGSNPRDSESISQSWWRRQTYYETTMGHSKYAANSLELPLTTMRPIEAPPAVIKTGNASPVSILIPSSSGGPPFDDLTSNSSIVNVLPRARRDGVEGKSHKHGYVVGVGPTTQQSRNLSTGNPHMSSDPPLLDPFSGVERLPSALNVAK